MGGTPDDERFRLLVESVDGFAIVTLALDGCVESWNPGILAPSDSSAALKRRRSEEIAFIFTSEDREAGIP